MLKADRQTWLKFLTPIVNDFLCKLLSEWMLSALVLNFTEKGDSLSPNLYRGITLLEHAFKLYKRFWMDRWASW